MRGAKCRTYKGHCSHVTNVRWTCDDKFLLSTGGMDATLLLWERVPAGQDFQEGKFSIFLFATNVDFFVMFRILFIFYESLQYCSLI